MPGAVDRLIEAAGSPGFERTLAQLREQRASDEAEAKAAQSYTERGLTVLSERPRGWDEAYIPLHYLKTADGAEADENAITNPAHWAVLSRSTPEAAEAAHQQAEAERAEAENRERRKVLALNKLGEAAMRVRREFVTKMVARKTPPKGAAIFVADCLAPDSYLLTHRNAGATTAELPGVDSTAGLAKRVSELAASGDGRAQVLTLALVLGALEVKTPKDAWRNSHPSFVGASNWTPRYVTSGDYLHWLADNGYQLAAVEDADGFVTLHGHAGGAINRGGFKILPETVRKVLVAHPAVGDACGVHDPRVGEVPFAAAEVQHGMLARSEAELKDWVRESLPQPPHPVAICIVDALPRNAAMKVRPSDVAALYR
jgi:acyl-CoA synthetase (AMP-forming)/AMP-acid ligase II